MSTATAITDQDVKVAITLACIGYLAEGQPSAVQQTTMKAMIQHHDLPTAGRWEIQWGPWKHETNL